MIISRTPFRISFFGGGTDYPAWYREHGGAVLAAAIDKYCYLTVRYLPPFFEHRYRVVYSKIENCLNLDEITHPAVREVLRFARVDRGVEIHHDGDLPARSGMGSSSAFVVGLLNAVYALYGQIPTKHQLALEGIHIEQDLLQEMVGSQDQVIAAYGGFNHIAFLPNGEIAVRPITITRDRMKELEAHLMLFYTGVKRTASNVAGSFVPNLNIRRRQLRLLQEMVEESISILTNREDIIGFGELLDEAWEAKRSLSDLVSSPELDEYYAAARTAGAVGGKLTGAGGGGFMLLFVPPDRQQAVRQALRCLIHVPFGFEFSGSQVIFFDPENDYRVAEQNRNAQEIQPFREMESSTGK
jgi:D-glycero-alpha-D-manno-heptose-7-phosphate kinase